MILHQCKEGLRSYYREIKQFLKENLELELHPDKSKIFSMYQGLSLLGFRIFYFYKLLRKRNIRQFKQRLTEFLSLYKEKLISVEQIVNSIDGWFAYARWGNTYELRKVILKQLNPILIN